MVSIEMIGYRLHVEWQEFHPNDRIHAESIKQNTKSCPSSDEQPLELTSAATNLEFGKLYFIVIQIFWKTYHRHSVWQSEQILFRHQQLKESGQSGIPL